MLALALSGCDGGNNSGANTVGGGQGLTLTALSWCDRPLITFQDDSTTSPTLLTSWSAVKDDLGFTTYLPESMPQGTCLALAGGSIHNPIYGGGQFSITYVLPTIGPVSFSEAPLRQGMTTKTQCIASAQDSKSTICVGGIANTSITIVSRQSAKDIQSIFDTLKANVAWVPGSKAESSSSSSGSTPTAPAATATPKQ